MRQARMHCINTTHRHTGGIIQVFRAYVKPRSTKFERMEGRSGQSYVPTDQSKAQEKKNRVEKDDTNFEFILRSFFPLTRSETKIIGAGIQIKPCIRDTEVLIFITDIKKDLKILNLYIERRSWNEFINKVDTYRSWFDMGSSNTSNLTDLLDSERHFQLSCVRFLDRNALRICSVDVPQGILMMSQTFEVLLELAPAVDILLDRLEAELPEVKRKMNSFGRIIYDLNLTSPNLPREKKKKIVSRFRVRFAVYDRSRTNISVFHRFGRRVLKLTSSPTCT